MICLGRRLCKDEQAVVMLASNKRCSLGSGLNERRDMSSFWIGLGCSMSNDLFWTVPGCARLVWTDSIWNLMKASGLVLLCSVNII